MSESSFFGCIIPLIWGPLPTLQLVQTGEQWTTDSCDLLPPLPVLQLRAELRGHQVVNVLDDDVHLWQDFLRKVWKADAVAQQIITLWRPLPSHDDPNAYLPFEVEPVEHFLQSCYFLFHQLRVPFCGVWNILNHKYMILSQFLCVFLLTDLTGLTSRLQSLVAEIKIILQILNVFHRLVHQLRQADVLFKVIFTSSDVIFLIFP